MRLYLLAFIFTISTTSIYAQWKNNNLVLSKRITTETKSITGFDKIDVSEDFEVYLFFSDTSEKVEIEANENLHEMIQVEKIGNTLKIDTKSYSTSWNSRRGAEERLVAYITVKNLSEIKANEDVAIFVEDKIFADQLTINLNEDSTLEAFVEVENLIVHLNEDSIVDIQGSAKTMQVNANEDSVINGYGFIVDDLDIVLIEDSEAKLTVNGAIDLRAKEDSYFYYRGNGSFTRKHLTGDSEVKH